MLSRDPGKHAPLVTTSIAVWIQAYNTDVPTRGGVVIRLFMDRACSGPCNNPGLTLYRLQFSAFAWFYVFYGEGAGRVKQIQAGRDVRTRRAQPGGFRLIRVLHVWYLHTDVGRHKNVSRRSGRARIALQPPGLAGPHTQMLL